jgi:ribosome biogenesis GTPase
VIDLADLGFQPYFSAQYAALAHPGLVPARIAADGPGIYHLLGCRAPLGEVSGRLRFDLEGASRPTVGDWVVVADDEQRAVIHHLLDRRTAMVRDGTDSSRRGRGAVPLGQVIAANVDVFFVVTSANRDLNPRRLERYLTAVWDSGAAPVIVLNKVDLVGDAATMREAVAEVALAAPLVEVSALTGFGIGALREHVAPGTTVALVGSSGVGKSSLINRLLGEEKQDVKAIREDDARGRHTTTRRELVPLPEGGMLIDTPGMRELGLTDDSGGMATAFADIAELAASCRFSDCRHETEPGCAVREAIALGAVPPGRWESYRKLQREIAAVERRRDPMLRAEERQKWKVINKSLRSHPKADQWR